MSNIENNDINDTKEIVQEVTPSVSSGNDGIENSEISELATAEVVKAEATEEVAPTVSSVDDEKYVIVYEKGMNEIEKRKKLDKFLAPYFTNAIKEVLHRNDIEVTEEITYNPQTIRDYFSSKGLEEKSIVSLISNIEDKRPKLSNYLLEWEDPLHARLKTDEDRREEMPDDEEDSSAILFNDPDPKKNIANFNKSINEEYGINIEITKELANDEKALIDYLDSTCPELLKEKKEQLVRTVSSAREIFNKTEYDKYEIPYGFRMNLSGIYKIEHKEKKDGSMVEIPVMLAQRAIYITSKFKNFDKNVSLKEKEFLGIEIHHKSGKIEELVVTPEDIFSKGKKGLGGLYNKKLLHFEDKEKDLAKFFVSFYDLNEDILNESIFADKNGWNADFTEFVFGNRVYFDGGFKEIHIPEKFKNDVTKGISSKGDIKEFERLTKPLFNTKAYRHLAYIAILSHVLRIIAAESVLINIYSQTTVGKTLICRLVMSQYGFAPEKGNNGLTKAASGSNAGFESVLYGYNDLPVFFDESKAEDEKEKNSAGLSIYNVVNGLSRNLANQDNTVKNSRDHTNSVFMTSEYEIVKSTDQQGKQVRTRFLEAEEYIPKLDSGDIIDIETAMSDHYGLFTETIMEVIFKHKSELRQKYHEYQIKLNKKASTRIESRVVKFYASIMVGGFLFKETLKILNEKYGTTFEIQNFEETEEYFLDLELKDRPVETLEIATLKTIWGLVNSDYEKHFANVIPSSQSRIGWLETNSKTARYELVILKDKLMDEILKDRKESFNQMCKAWNKLKVINPYPRGTRGNAYTRPKNYSTSDDKSLSGDVVVFYVDRLLVKLGLTPKDALKNLGLDGEYIGDSEEQDAEDKPAIILPDFSTDTEKPSTPERHKEMSDEIVAKMKSEREALLS